MYALTLHQPYAWAIPRGKDFENRTWTPPDRMLGEFLAIHAGARRPTPQNVDAVAHAMSELRHREVTVPSIGQYVRGAITAIARLQGWAQIEEGKVVRVHAVTPEARLVVARFAAASPFVSGPFAWYLDLRLELRSPIPCKGYQKLWRVPKDVLARLNLQLETLL
jgi:hypothetical protein